MMQITPKSAVLNYVILITVQLKWVCDFLLYQSFFQHHASGLTLHEEYDIDDFRYETSTDDAECAVCLCKINEGEEVSELRCRHLYHKVCLDRWLGYGHVTCPLCRNHVKPPQILAELHQELIVVNFSAARSRDDRCMWWLR